MLSPIQKPDGQTDIFWWSSNPDLYNSFPKVKLTVESACKSWVPIVTNYNHALFNQMCTSI